MLVPKETQARQEFDLLIACIDSDQVSARQLVEHLKDERFLKYFVNQRLGRCQNARPK